jgi:hypothetical protein
VSGPAAPAQAIPERAADHEPWREWIENLAAQFRAMGGHETLTCLCQEESAQLPEWLVEAAQDEEIAARYLEGQFAYDWAKRAMPEQVRAPTLVLVASRKIRSERPRRLLREWWTARRCTSPVWATSAPAWRRPRRANRRCHSSAASLRLPSFASSASPREACADTPSSVAKQIGTELDAT